MWNAITCLRLGDEKVSQRRILLQQVVVTFFLPSFHFPRFLSVSLHFHAISLQEWSGGKSCYIKSRSWIKENSHQP